MKNQKFLGNSVPMKKCIWFRIFWNVWCIYNFPYLLQIPVSPLLKKSRWRDVFSLCFRRFKDEKNKFVRTNFFVRMLQKFSKYFFLSIFLFQFYFYGRGLYLPLDPACFWIEDPSRNRLPSTAYFPKVDFQVFAYLSKKK